MRKVDYPSNAVHDKVDKPSMMSINWGAAEVQWTGQAMEAFAQAFIDAAAMGVTICVAAGTMVLATAKPTPSHMGISLPRRRTRSVVAVPASLPAPAGH